MRSIVVALALLGVWLPISAWAQESSVIPELSIAFDQSAYDQLEPVLLTLTLKNPASGLEMFSDPYPRGAYDYVLVGPGGDTLSVYSFYHNVSTPAVIDMEPDETRNFTVNLLRFYPASIDPGSYSLSVTHQDDESVSASASYVVQASEPQGAFNALADAVLGVWDLRWWTLTSTVDQDDELQRLAGDQDLPRYGRELAFYLYALAAEVRGTVAGDRSLFEEATSRYEVFLQGHPESVYAGPARYGSSWVAVNPVDEIEPAASGTLTISAFDANQGDPGEFDDYGEFVKLTYSGTKPASADDHVLVFYDGYTEVSYYTLDLFGPLEPGSSYVIGNPGVANARLTFPPRTLQNGPDAIALYRGRSAADFPPGTDLVFDDIVSAVVYEADDDVYGSTQTTNAIDGIQMTQRRANNSSAGQTPADILRGLRDLAKR